MVARRRLARRAAQVKRVVQVKQVAHVAHRRARPGSCIGTHSACPSPVSRVAAQATPSPSSSSTNSLPSSHCRSPLACFATIQSGDPSIRTRCKRMWDVLNVPLPGQGMQSRVAVRSRVTRMAPRKRHRRQCRHIPCKRRDLYSSKHLTMFAKGRRLHWSLICMLRCEASVMFMHELAHLHLSTCTCPSSLTHLHLFHLLCNALRNTFRATAYAIVKLLMPVRVAISVALTPWFARAVVERWSIHTWASMRRNIVERWSVRRWASMRRNIGRGE